MNLWNLIGKGAYLLVWLYIDHLASVRVVWCFFGRVGFILVTKIIKATAVYILLILRCFWFILIFINCTNIVCARFNFVLRTCMFVPTGQSSQVSLAFYKLTKHKIAKFANLSFLDCFPVILEWQAAALNEVAAWLTMTYLIRAKTPLVKNITYFSINLIDAYTTSTLKGAILKAMRFLLIESFEKLFCEFLQGFLDHRTGVCPLRDVSSYLSHFSVFLSIVWGLLFCVIITIDPGVKAQ